MGSTTAERLLTRVWASTIAPPAMPQDPAQPDAHPTDDALIQAIADGQVDAMCVLVRRHQDTVRRLAGHVLRDEHTADDVAQDVFLRVHRAAGGYKPAGQFVAWIRRITLNLCRDRLRRRKRRPISLDVVTDQPAADLPDRMEQRETILRVRHAVDELPPRQRTAVLLHRYEGMTHTQIAESTGWTRPAVESLLVRAYVHLRRVLADLL